MVVQYKAILSFQGDRFIFSWACATAAGSISTASIWATGFRWAAIRANSPEPVPMSKIVRACKRGAHAPISTPSVPTFMAHRSCLISNCLNLKLLLLILRVLT